MKPYTFDELRQARAARQSTPSVHTFKRAYPRLSTGCERMDGVAATMRRARPHMVLAHRRRALDDLNTGGRPMGTFSHAGEAAEGNPPSDTPTSVYRYYDQHDVLLYVGITSRGTKRNREHNESKAWWRYVVRQEVDHFPDRASALAREKKLIQTNRPPFNIQHNPGASDLRGAYVAFAEAVQHSLQPTQLVKMLNGKIPLDYWESTGDRFLYTNPTHGSIVRLLSWPDGLKVMAQGKKVLVSEVKTSGAIASFKLKDALGPHGAVRAYVKWENSRCKNLIISKIVTEAPAQLYDVVPPKTLEGVPCSWPRSFRKLDEVCRNAAVATVQTNCRVCKAKKRQISCRRHALIWLSFRELRCHRCRSRQVDKQDVEALWAIGLGA